ncbi:MAG: thiamine pyrophosphate-dependent enzyme [Acidobacteriaceae bacterium]
MATKVRELTPVATPNSSHPNPLISHEKLQQLYSMMLKCRLLDERARILEKQAGFKNDHYSSVGLEATAVGAAIDLLPADTLAPSHRDFILSYLKGVPLTAMFSQLYGHNTRPENGRSALDDCGYAPLNIVLAASTVAAQLDVCTDIAFANQRKKNDNVVMIFSDEGSIQLNDWHDALRFAGQRSLPIVFVHQSHRSAGSLSVKLESTGDDTSSEAVGYGFPGITVDGNDAVAVYRVAQEATERARSGGGPTLIEAQTFPEYVSSDPIAAMERYLAGKGLFSESWKKGIIALFQQKLDAAVDVAENDRCG